MNRAVAAQLVYSRVEEDQSTRGQPGFQTVLYTRDILQSDEVEEIEARLFLDTSRGPAAKRVFFETTQRRVVLARLTGVDSLDSAGRGGVAVGAQQDFTRFSESLQMNLMGNSITSS